MLPKSGSMSLTNRWSGCSITGRQSAIQTPRALPYPPGRLTSTSHSSSRMFFLFSRVDEENTVVACDG
jgi:hypothetical protein